LCGAFKWSAPSSGSGLHRAFSSPIDRGGGPGGRLRGDDALPECLRRAVLAMGLTDTPSGALYTASSDCCLRRHSFSRTAQMDALVCAGAMLVGMAASISPGARHVGDGSGLHAGLPLMSWRAARVSVLCSTAASAQAARIPDQTDSACGGGRVHGRWRSAARHRRR
jgi:hypothetical protein